MGVRTRWTAGALAGLLTLVVTGCGGDDSSGGSSGGDGDGLVTVRIAHNSNAAALPAQVALAQGFFADHGLDVEFTQVEDTATLPPALGTSFDIVLSAPTLELSATAHNIPMVVVTGATVDTEENPTVAVIASGASGITDISQLEGKTFGSLSPTGTSGIASDLWMQRSGVDLSTVNIILVTGPQQADQMAAGRVDAVVSVAPFTSAVMALPGSVNLGDPYLQMAPRISGINWASSKQWAEENADTLADFTAAMDDAIDYIASNDADARKILQSYTQLSDEAAAKLVFPTYETEVRQDDLDLWLDAMREVSDFKDDVDTTQMVLGG